MTCKPRTCSERGQALILALLVLALLGAFSVAILSFASGVQTTVASTRRAAYQDTIGDAGALAARDLVAQGLGCPTAPVQTTTTFASSEMVSITPVSWVPPQPAVPPRACVPGTGGNGPDAGTYCLAAKSSAAGNPPIYATVRIFVDNNGSASIAHVHFENGSSYTC